MEAWLRPFEQAPTRKLFFAIAAIQRNATYRTGRRLRERKKYGLQFSLGRHVIESELAYPERQMTLALSNLKSTLWFSFVHQPPSYHPVHHPSHLTRENKPVLNAVCAQTVYAIWGTWLHLPLCGGDKQREIFFFVVLHKPAWSLNFWLLVFVVNLVRSLLSVTILEMKLGKVHRHFINITLVVVCRKECKRSKDKINSYIVQCAIVHRNNYGAQTYTPGFFTKLPQNSRASKLKSFKNSTISSFKFKCLEW